MGEPTLNEEPPARGARAAAGRLAPEFGAGLPGEVEAALHATGRVDERYLDPIALSALIVSAAQLAWTVYLDMRKRTNRPAREAVARRMRVELSDRSNIEADVRDRVIDVVIAETLPPDQ